MEDLIILIPAVVLCITHYIKKYVPKGYTEFVAVLIGSISNVLMTLPADWVSAIEPIIGGGVLGAIATIGYKVAEEISNKK